MTAVSTRKGDGFYGYKLHLALCTRTGLPLAWRVETARRNESLYVAPLLDALDARRFRSGTCAMDKWRQHPGAGWDARARDHPPSSVSAGDARPR
jgi:Transposase DDE domain